MPEQCNCGAELPPDALFCHKCGKPQRELPKVEPVVSEAFIPVAAPAVAPPAIAAEPLPMTFRNPVAIRVAMWVAFPATLLSLFLPFLTWIVAGFTAVVFYGRKTGSRPNMRAGVRLGWLTGVIMFVLWAVLFTIQQVPDALSGRLGAKLQEQMATMQQMQDPAMQQMFAFFQTGPGIFAVLLVSLVFFFLFITGLSIAGGALGAKMAGRSQ